MQRRLLSFPFLLILISCISNFNLIGQNDDCANAIELTLEDGVVSDIFSNLDATTSDEDGDVPDDCFAPIDAEGTPDAYQNTVYFSFVGDGNSYQITTSIDCDGIGDAPNADTQIVLFEGSCGGAVIACNDDIDAQANEFLSIITIDTEAETEYFLLVDGYNGTVGDFCIAIEDTDTSIPECTLSASFFAGTPGDFEESETPFATGFSDWGAVNPDPATVLIAVAALSDMENEPYTVSSSAGTTYAEDTPPIAIEGLQITSGGLGLIALTQDDLDNAGETITITLQSTTNDECSQELSFATADFTPDFSAYPPGEGGPTPGVTYADGICDPASTIENLEGFEQETVCLNASDAPALEAPAASLPDVDFVVEINGVISTINADGSLEGLELSEGDEVCYTPFTYDLEGINGVLNEADMLCPLLDDLFPELMPCGPISDLLEGVNDGEPGLNSLQEALDFAGSLSAPVTSVEGADTTLSNLNDLAGGFVGFICYATAERVCVTVIDDPACSPTPICGAVASTLSATTGDACETGVIEAEVVDAGNVPEGYVEVFVLTSGDDLVVEDLAFSPSFELEGDEEGIYTIHSLVLDTLTFPGDNDPTTGGEAYALTIDGGGDICASLDVAGAAFELAACPTDTMEVELGEGVYNDLVCDPSTLISELAPLDQETIFDNASDAPVLTTPETTLPNIDFVVEVNEEITVINEDGSLEGIDLEDGDQVCYTAFTYDLPAINELLDTAAILCPGLCNLLLPGLEEAVDTLFNGFNDGDPGLNSLQEALDFAASFGNPIGSVEEAAVALDGINGQIGALLGSFICYAASETVCVDVIESVGGDPLDADNLDTAVSDDETMYDVVFEITGGSGDYIVTVDGTTAEPELDGGTATIAEVACGSDIEILVVDNETEEEITVEVEAPCDEMVEALETDGLTIDETESATYNITFDIINGSGDYTVTADGTTAEPEEDNGTVTIEEVECGTDVEILVVDNDTGEEATLEVEGPDCEPSEFSCDDFPIEISVDYSCNENSGIYTITYSISGGLPQYAFENGFGGDSLFYSVSGDFNDEFYAYSPDNNFVVQFTDVTPYELTATDNAGCFANVGETPASCVKTAIELIEFEGKALVEGNQLNWSTATEQKSSHFILERSYDEVNFNTIGQLFAAGESYELRSYNLLDNGVTAKIAYYRLISVDLEGNQTMSNVITIVRGDDLGGFGILGIGPNPTKGELTLSIQFENIKDFSIHITDVTGKEVGSGGDRSEAINAGIYQLQLNVSDYPAGLYFVKVSDGNKTDVIKFIKKD